ncbi:MAG: cupin domain-containing protein [Oscillospiraceae bacterium]
MANKIVEIAERIKALREILELSVQDVADYVGVSPQDYIAVEDAKHDVSISFLYKCAEKFGVDIVELLTGENPHLSFYTVTRKGKGIEVNRRAGFNYRHVAYNLKNKKVMPLVVTAPFSGEEQDKDIELSVHEGQEFDYVLSGALKVKMEDKVFILNEGDSMMYDSSHGHGMIATNGEDCRFIAIVIKK